MTTEEKQAYLEKIRRSRGYVLEMHRIMVEADLEWVKAYEPFVETTYTGQRLLDRLDVLPANGRDQAPTATSGRLGTTFFEQRDALGSSLAGSVCIDLDPQQSGDELDGTRIALGGIDGRFAPVVLDVRVSLLAQ